MSDKSDFTREFLSETSEGLDRLENDLVVLESDPQNLQRLDSIFRILHTIKGNSGFFQFGRLGALAHCGENLLGRLRGGEIVLNSEMTTRLLELVDAIRDMITHIHRAGAEDEQDHTELMDKLAQLASPIGASDVPAATDTKGNLPDIAATMMFASPKEKTVSKKREKAVARKPPVENPPVEKPPAPTVPVEDSSSFAGTSSSLRVARSGSSHPQTGLSGSDIRVGVALLDDLMNLVGELVLARNQILQVVSTDPEAALASCCQRLNLVTTELQEGVMKTRMQHIGTMWQRFPRFVRDLARQCGKNVELDMQGVETDLDKSLIEMINDPLTHVVRNAVDHGIEAPEARLKAGKPERGRLRLRAFQESGQVNIEISDDGAGMDLEKIRRKAVERRLASPEQIEAMSERSTYRLVLEPGFSTAETVTDVSGRGVGLDVVRTNVDSIGGSVEIHSRRGEGTTIRMKIPLTLAIIPALIVSAGGSRYAIPQASLIEMLSLEGDNAKQQIEWVHDAPVFRLRGNLLPLVSLNEQLKDSRGVAGVERSEPADLNASGAHFVRNQPPGAHFEADPIRKDDDVLNIVVLTAEDRQFGLIVDEINNAEEIVVKPLGSLMHRIPVYAGATIMGDGVVVLILDVVGLARRAGMLTRSRDRHMGLISQPARRDPELDRLARQNLLVCQIGREHYVAIPISQVTRLERIPTAAIEKSVNRHVVQYRGRIMPLIRLKKPDDETNESGRHSLQLVISTRDERTVGLIVDRIIDIVEQPVQIEHLGNQHGIVGSAVIGGCVTDLVDLDEVIRHAEPELFGLAEVE